jgi:serine protease
MNRVLQVVCVVLALVASSAYAKPKADKMKKHPHQGVREEYIVVLEDGTKAEDVEALARELADTYKLDVKELFAWSLQGFLVGGKDKDVEELTADDRVKYVEQNAVGQHVEDRISAMQWSLWNDEYLWHLDRIDETTWPLRDGQHNMCTEGRGAYAYVIDTGIWNGHSEFIEPVPSRVVRSLDFVGNANGATDTLNGCAPSPALTSNYHGTAVASVLAGTHIGAAKTQLVSLRMFDCNMNVNTADMIEALDWIASPNNPYRGSPGVINHSGFVPVWDGLFQAYGDAVVRTVNNTNIPFFTSADNFSTDACKFSPNNRAYTRYNKTGRAFVVGGTSVGGTASDPNDYRWQEWNTNGTAKIGAGAGSNGGACVSIYAPAVSTYIAFNTGANNYGRLSGTSFSSPMVAAVAARYMQKRRAESGVIPTATQVYEWLLSQSTTAVQNTNTAPTYWMCVQQTASGGFYSTTHATRPASCPIGYQLVEMPFATNTSDARMLYWDEGYCP